MAKVVNEFEFLGVFLFVVVCFVCVVVVLLGFGLVLQGRREGERCLFYCGFTFHLKIMLPYKLHQKQQY